MNLKGQAAVGAMVMVAISVIVGLVLISSGISDDAARLTSTRQVNNQSFTFPAAGAETEIDGCANYQGTPLITNGSAGMEEIPSTNYTFKTKISPADSQKSLFLNASVAICNGKAVNLTYTCVPDGYSEDSLGRVFPPLIILFCCLAIAVTVIVVAIKNGGIIFR